MLSHRLSKSFVLAALLSAGVLSSGVSRAQTPAAAPAPTEEAGHGHHIRIRTALSYLKDARWDLNHADKSFYGMSQEALADVDTAIKAGQVAMGVAPDPDPKDAPDVTKEKFDTGGLDHPLLDHAARSLGAARVQLVDATSSFEGHRHEAIAAVDSAIHKIADAIHKDDMEGARRLAFQSKMTPAERFESARDELTTESKVLHELPSDKAGHAAKATKLVDDALKELEQAKAE